jgi:hypothetical protein
MGVGGGKPERARVAMGKGKEAGDTEGAKETKED